MATTDIRFQRINEEYLTVRNAQDKVIDKVDTFESAVLGLTEAVSRNAEMIAENREMIMEVSAKLDAIIEHLEVPYEKPPMGFQKD